MRVFVFASLLLAITGCVMSPGLHPQGGGGDGIPVGDGPLDPILPGVEELDLGDGHDGDLVVDLDETVVPTTCLAVVGLAGDQLELSSVDAVEPGDRLLLMQTQQSLSHDPYGDTLPIKQEAGAYEIVDVIAVDGASGVVQLSGTPMALQDADGTAQACVAPQYESVTIHAGGSLIANPWNGVGGVVAFHVRDTLILEGTIDVDGAGFRGGRTQSNDESRNVTALDHPLNPERGGGKGEGLHTPSFHMSGRGALGNAGGGGNGHNAGGGGGGNGGAGGLGGFANSQDDPDDWPFTQGKGGGFLDRTVVTLSFGGGGGAGHQNNGNGGAGGDGGGVVWVVGGEIAGAGLITAGGVAGGAFIDSGDPDGAGGGGAGGTIVVRAARLSTFEGVLDASGADGGDTFNLEQPHRHGPGGGGGGGLIYLQRVQVAGENTRVPGGVHGLVNSGPVAERNWGSTAGGAGRVRWLSGGPAQP